MRVLNRKSKPQQFLETLNDSLDRANQIRSVLPGGGGSGTGRKAAAPTGTVLKAAMPTGRALKAAVPKDKAVKVGLVAGGLAGLTAGSAGISSLRRRQEGARDDS